MRDGPSDLMQMKHDQAGTSGKSEKEHSVSVHPVLLEANSRLFHHAAYLESLSRLSDEEKRMERIKGGGGDEKGLKIRACRWRGICVHGSNKVVATRLPGPLSSLSTICGRVVSCWMLMNRLSLLSKLSVSDQAKTRPRAQKTLELFPTWVRSDVG